MKRIWIMCICICLCLALVGCAASVAPSEEQTAPAEEQIPEEPDGDSALLPDMDRLREGLNELPEFDVPTEITMDDVRGQAGVYQKISAEQALLMMQDLADVTVVDVRTQEEYDAGHIEGAVLVPSDSIGDTQPDALPDTEKVLLVYCRSGVRSEAASRKLLNLGYLYVYDFGGIIDWPYDVVQ